MTIPPADQACPVDLGYPEPEPPRLDLPAIIRRGQRVRRRRRLAGAASAVAACAVAAGLVAVALRPAGPAVSQPEDSGPWALLADPAVQAELAVNPPATVPAILSSRPGYTTIAWTTRRGAVCWAAVARAGSDGGSSQSCPAWTRPDIPGEGRRGLSPPLPGLGPPPPDHSLDLQAWYGLTTSAASRVVLTFFGRTYTARPVPLRLASGRTVGAFLVFMRLPPGTTTFTESDITREVAYNRAGQVVASHGRW